MADRITLTLPPDPEYTPAIRLLLSGVASVMGFTVDEIEDIRSCASEACLLLLNGQHVSGLELDVEAGDSLNVKVMAHDVAADENAGFEDFSEEISRLMIEALSDECEFTEENGLLCEVDFTKTKNCETEGGQ